MAKKKQGIEEAVIVEESTSILLADFKAPVLPKLIDRTTSIVTIKESLKEYSEIEINGTKDKANYDKVSKGMAKFKSDRVAWEKSVNQSISEPVKQWLADTKSDIAEIVAEFKSAEGILRAKKDAIDTLKAEEKQAAETAKLKVMAERIEAIVNLGGKSDGTRYLFDYDITLFVSIAQLKDMEEVKWKNELAEIKKAYDFEQDRLADQKKVEEELAEANNTKEKELKEKQRKLRIKELTLMGFTHITPDNDMFEDKDGNQVGIGAIDEDSDEEWDEMIAQLQSVDKSEDIDDLYNLLLEVPQTTEPYTDLSFEPIIKAAIPAIDYEPKEELSFDIVKAEEEMSNMAMDNGFKTVVLQFDALDPYIEFPMGEGFIQRQFHTDFSDYAFELTPNQTVVLKGEINHQLQFLLIKVN